MQQPLQNVAYYIDLPAP